MGMRRTPLSCYVRLS